MFAVTTDKEVHALQDSGAVLSVLLAEAYDASLLRWLADIWTQLHLDSGMKWHVVVPAKCSAFELNENGFRAQDFNTELSRDLARQYGVEHGNMPCLLFDDFNEEEHQRYISLGTNDERALIEIFRFIARTIERRHPGRDLRQSECRDIIDAVVDGVNSRRLLASGLKIAPRAFSIVARLGRRVVAP